MTVPCPQEFRDDVVRVARNRGPGRKLAVIAKDSGISKSRGTVDPAGSSP